MQESGSADTSFHVVQPGSSVATALSEGESKPKHVLVLEILKEAWRTVKHPLHTVRPFFFRSVSPPLFPTSISLCSFQGTSGLALQRTAPPGCLDLHVQEDRGQYDLPVLVRENDKLRPLPQISMIPRCMKKSQKLAKTRGEYRDSQHCCARRESCDSAWQGCGEPQPGQVEFDMLSQADGCMWAAWHC